VTDPQPHEITWTLTNAEIASRCLHVVAELGVADAVGDQPVTAEALASTCAVNADALHRVLCLLADYDVFQRVRDGFGHTAASQLLRTEHPMSMRAFPQMMGQPLFCDTFGQLGYSVRTGSPALQTVEPKGLWGYYQSRPEEGRIFGQAMAAKAAADVASVLSAYDFDRFGVIADIGGGRGHLLRAVLDATPNAEGCCSTFPQ